MGTVTKYETDFYGWTQQQADLLKRGKLDALDLANLIEELESMGKSETRQLHNRLEVLHMHLLKWRYQPNLQSTSRQQTISEQRRRLAKHLRQNPSLKNKLDEIHLDTYDDARHSAMLETGLLLETFPENCPWTIGQTMDPDFFQA